MSIRSKTCFPAVCSSSSCVSAAASVSERKRNHVNNHLNIHKICQGMHRPDKFCVCLYDFLCFSLFVRRPWSSNPNGKTGRNLEFPDDKPTTGEMTERPDLFPSRCVFLFVCFFYTVVIGTSGPPYWWNHSSKVYSWGPLCFALLRRTRASRSSCRWEFATSTSASHANPTTCPGTCTSLTSYTHI